MIKAIAELDPERARRFEENKVGLPEIKNFVSAYNNKIIARREGRPSQLADGNLEYPEFN